MSFEMLIDELAEVANKRRLQKALDPDLPTYYIEEMPPLLAQFHQSEPRSLEELQIEVDSLTKSFGTPSTNRRSEAPHRDELRKALPAMFERFSEKLKQSLISGAVSPEQASLLEWHRNQLAQNFAARGLL